MPPAAVIPSRCVLVGVPQARFYRGGDVRCPEDFPFEGCLRACLEYLGAGFGCDKAPTRLRPDRDYGCTYSYVLAATGSGFFLGRNEDAWRRGSFEPVAPFADDWEPVRRACWAVGRTGEFVPAGSPDAGRARIVGSIRDAGRPVLARGVVGPPEWCLITGYDAGGDTLIGWSYFQDEPAFNTGLEYEPDGSFRKSRWESNIGELVLLGEEAPVPPTRELLRQVLAWGVELLRSPSAAGQPAGPAAFAAWTELIGRDEDWPESDPALVLARYECHHGWVGGLAEARWYCGEYLQRIAKRAPEVAEHLLAAQRCFVAEHDLMWDVWRLAGGIGVSPAHAARFAPAEVRARAIGHIHRAGGLDREAASHLALALAALA